MARALFALNAALVLIAATGSVSAASRSISISPSASAKALPQFGPLDAAQIGRIQGVSQAVLSAKQQEQPGDDEKALVDELHNLGASLDTALQPNVGSIRLVSALPSAAVQAPAVAVDPIQMVLTPALSGVHQRGQALKNRAASKTGSAAETARLNNLVSKAGDIEQSVRDALLQPEPNRRAQLTRLRESLRPKSLSEELTATGNPVPGSQPTMTTLVRHRSAAATPIAVSH